MRSLGKHHPQLKELRLLRDSSGRRRQGRFLLEGVRLLEEALAAGLIFEQLFYRPDRLADERARRLLDASAAVACELLPESLAKLSETESDQGLIAVVPIPTAPPARMGQLSSLLILEGVADPGNAGTLIRAARAAGVGGVVLRQGVDAYNPKLVRASAGALFWLPVWQDVALEEIRQSGFSLLAAVARGGENPYEFALPTRPAWLLGGEAQGLAPASLEQSQNRLTLPMQGSCESLNVAMAGTLLMFEWVRQGRATQT